ncbi:helix-turn-helix domain-containing protein, partial [Escherichia coli]
IRHSVNAYEQYEQVGRLLAGGVSRRQVALIFDIGLSTLYRYYPASISEK